MIRQVNQIITPNAVTDGAGVTIKRSIATRTLDYLDPFLLFDHFGSDNPDDYMAGFPMHPHRGIETVTYMQRGLVRHEDSIGNAGVIGPGDVQWMTAGRGIMHEEMPQPGDTGLSGFQLWVNLPAAEKMTAPRYQEVLADEIPVVQLENGGIVRVITGSYEGRTGPVTEIAVAPVYLDVHLPAGSGFTIDTPIGHTVFAYAYDGGGNFANVTVNAVQPLLVVFEDGSSLQAEAGDQSFSFLLVMGRPIGEPIARYGPFVMNTREEIMQALRDLENGTFVS